MTDEEVLDDRLTKLEQDVAIMRAVAGRVTLPTSFLALLWAVLLVVVSGVIFVVRIDTNVGSLTKAVETNQTAIIHHIEQPWHAAAGEKYNAIDRRQEAIEARLNRSGR